jgi:hypothetical protein
MIRASSDARAAVFLHGGWRCASTYVWSRFRAAEGTTCFYEPFAERLAHTSRKGIGRDTAGGWESRHPPLTAPYRAEYRPLLRGLRHGVRGYREAFALERYFPRNGVRAEVAYLSRLIEHARRDGKAAVLGFSRSLARAGALKSALGGYHVVIRRNPRQQWLSCRSFRGQGPMPYFELGHFLILTLAPSDSPAGRFARSLGLPRMPRWASGVTRQLGRLQAQLGTWDEELSYRAFLGVYLLSYTTAASAADLVLDVDRLDRSAQYREQAGAAVRRGTGLAVDFSDCRVAQHESADLALDFAGIEADVRRRLSDFGADLDAALIPGHAQV